MDEMDETGVPPVNFRRDMYNPQKRKQSKREKKEKEEEKQEEEPRKAPPSPDGSSTIDLTA